MRVTRIVPFDHLQAYDSFTLLSFVSIRFHEPFREDSTTQTTLHMWLCKSWGIPTLTVSTVKRTWRASLVAQWLRICLPMQGTRVRALVWEDPTCRGAAKPVSHSYWACASGACAPPTREAAMVRGPRTAMKSGPRLPQLEKALAQKRRPNTAKNK